MRVGPRKLIPPLVEVVKPYVPEDSARLLLGAIAGAFDVASRDPRRTRLARTFCRMAAQVFRSEAARLIPGRGK